MTAYASLKFVHVLVAIIALGTSAGLGILLEFFGNHPVHGAFVLRAIRRLLYLIVAPGYALMFVTGIGLTKMAWSMSVGWIQAAMGLWALGAVLLSLSIRILNKQIALFESEGPSSAAYRRAALLERLLGGGTGLVVVTIVYFMVTKPSG
jgi:uncharacterized membrane protein